MEKDFYIDQRWLASYFEKDWFDKVSVQLSDVLSSQFPSFPNKILYSPYHKEFVSFIHKAINKVDAHPTSLLEVGSSLGRTFYEICRAIKSVNNSVLLEPSQNLARGFEKIFSESGDQLYPILYGNRDMTEVKFNSDLISSSCAHVDRKLLNCSYENAPGDLGSFDLVLCSNVVDQCHEPEALVNFLKERTAENGLLALSCTYQWNDKYIAPERQTISNIAELFGQEWHLLGETNVEFKCRRVERHWLAFLSQVLIFQKM